MSWVLDVWKTLGGSFLFFHTLTWWAPTFILSTYFYRFLFFVDHVDNARGRRCGERNNSKDDGEGLAGPTDGLIQRRCSFRKPGS